MSEYSLKDLRILDALLEHRHVSQAAHRMAMSQPAMSMALKRLRGVFGDELLIRRGNRLIPTETAIRLQPKIRPLINQMQELVTDISGFNPALSQRCFTLILTDYIDAVLVPRLSRRIQTAAPLMQLRVVGPNPFRLADMFSGGQVDLTVTYFPGAPQELISKRLFSDRMVCVAREGNPALFRPLSLEGFCALDHVTIEPAEASMYRAVLDEALQKHGMSRRISVSKPDFMGVPFLLEQSDLIATMPAKIATLFAEKFALRIFEPPIELPELDIRMMWHKSTQRSEPHLWLRQTVADVIRELLSSEAG